MFCGFLFEESDGATRFPIDEHLLALHPLFRWSCTLDSQLSLNGTFILHSHMNSFLFHCHFLLHPLTLQYCTQKCYEREEWITFSPELLVLTICWIPVADLLFYTITKSMSHTDPKNTWSISEGLICIQTLNNHRTPSFCWFNFEVVGDASWFPIYENQERFRLLLPTSICFPYLRVALSFRAPVHCCRCWRLLSL